MKSGFEHEIFWYPLRIFGVDHPFFTLNSSTIISTWIALSIIVILCLLARLVIRPQQDHSETLLLTTNLTAADYGRYFATSVIRSFMSLVEQSTGTFVHRYFSFIASLFIFILICNWVALIPYSEEPTKDLNTTLALGIIALLYIQKEIIKVHGFRHYLKEYFLPVSTFFPLNIFIGLCFAPFKILGELATVISLSFRLFGNIFGGAIIMKILHESIRGSLFGQIINTLFSHLLLVGFFILFEGGLQAFVFAILTLTNIGMATAIEEGKH
jgi:F-type H+-transporting ATPase subunit a